VSVPHISITPPASSGGTVADGSVTAAKLAPDVAPALAADAALRAALGSATPDAALTPWFAALANRDNAPAKILCIGDSITEGQGATTEDRRWVSRLRDGLRRRHPVTGALGSGGGRGFLPGYHATTSFPQTWTLTGGASQNSSFGIGRKGIKFSSAGTATATLIGTSLDVHAVIGSAGSVTVTVDGGTPTTITTTGGTLGGETTTRIALGTSGSHSVVLTWVSGTPYVGGFTLYDGDENAGIRMAEAGYFGQKTDYWNQGYWDLGPLHAYAPHLVVIALSMNDYGASSDVAAITPQLQTFFARLLSSSHREERSLAALSPKGGAHRWLLEALADVPVRLPILTRCAATAPATPQAGSRCLASAPIRRRPWPLEAQTQREADLWALEWRRPQAHEWARLGLELEVALYVRAFTEAEVPDASGKVRDYVRMSRENLGLSVPGLARHRWRIAGTPASAPSSTAAPRPTAPRSSGSRARFKVVPPPEDTD
jgi:hypothetical protein